MIPSYNRVYPTGGMAASFVGFTCTPTPIRPSWPGWLAWSRSTTPYWRAVRAASKWKPGPTAIRSRLPRSNVTPAVPARNLRLTIQAGIQWEAERECKLRVAQDHARNCSIIVMTRTGKILAMAQWPTYNPAAPSSYAATTNIGVANVFAPGSTLKPITVAAALEKGGQTPLSTYTVPPQITMDHQFTFHDAEAHPTVRYTIAGILAHSSNVGMVQVVQHITPMQQYDYLRAFGLGSVSGLNMPGESGGLLPKPGTAGYWADNPFEYSFGQGLDVTAVQMASVYATIANGGVRVQPTIVAGTTSADGTFSPAPEPVSRRVIRARTARELMTILQQVPALNAQGGEPWGVIKRLLRSRPRPAPRRFPGRAWASASASMVPATSESPRLTTRSWSLPSIFRTRTVSTTVRRSPARPSTT